MNPISFKFGGPLTAQDAAVYVERDADRTAAHHLQRMDYLLLIEPRQQGKTSLVYRLRDHLLPETHVLAYLYCTSHIESEREWYRAMGEDLLDQVFGRPAMEAVALPKDSASWYGFLRDSAVRLQELHRYAVIALDEIGAIPPAWSEAFFSVLHRVFCERGVRPELGRVTFILAGAYDPRDLIRDPKVSPFNVAHRVHLADFTLAQVRELVGKAGWAEEQARMLAERVHYWTGGQPYLTQMLGHHLGSGAMPADMDRRIVQLCVEDENHLKPLLKRLRDEKTLFGYVKRVLSGEQIKFSPEWHAEQAKLGLLGVLKPDENRCCAIRNRIYEQVLIEMLEPPEPPEDERLPDARALLPILVERMDEQELRTLCFDLKIDYDDLRGEGFSAKTRELLRYAEKRERLADIVAWVRRERPDIEL